MGKWFECNLSYEKITEDGKMKKVKEGYLVDAISCTEAETRLIKEMEPFISGEFSIKAVKEANYTEVFFSYEDFSDLWFKCKLFYITLDEKSGTEKKISTQVLVQAIDFRDAVKKLDESMKGTMADYIISSISDTNIYDVYPYKGGE